jgi:hypothetical protein
MLADFRGVIRFQLFRGLTKRSHTGRESCGPRTAALSDNAAFRPGLERPDQVQYRYVLI